VPHDTTDSVTVKSGIWFAWPINIPLLPANQTAFATAAGSVPRIVSATAQLTTHATLEDGTGVLFFVETVGVNAEVVLSLGDGATVSSTPGCSASTDDGDTVLRSIKAATSAFAVLSIGATTVKLVLLPADHADRIFKIADSGRVLIAGDGGVDGGLQTQLLMEELPTGEIQVRTALESTEIWACPPLSTTKGTTDGVFQKYSVLRTTQTPTDTNPSIRPCFGSIYDAGILGYVGTPSSLRSQRYLYRRQHS